MLSIKEELHPANKGSYSVFFIGEAVEQHSQRVSSHPGQLPHCKHACKCWLSYQLPPSLILPVGTLPSFSTWPAQYAWDLALLHIFLAYHGHLLTLYSLHCLVIPCVPPVLTLSSSHAPQLGLLAQPVAASEDIAI